MRCQPYDEGQQFGMVRVATLGCMASKFSSRLMHLKVGGLLDVGAVEPDCCVVACERVSYIARVMGFHVVRQCNSHVSGARSQ
jgi:hypothetical protein